MSSADRDHSDVARALLMKALFAAGILSVLIGATALAQQFQVNGSGPFNLPLVINTWSPSPTATPTPTPSPTPSGAAMRANDFLNTLGIDSHVVQHKTAPAELQTGITYLGVRHDRDDFTADPFDSRQPVSTIFCPIHQATGATYIGMPNAGDLSGTKTSWDEFAACGSLFSVEGPNEPNNQPFSYNGAQCSQSGSFLPCEQFQRDLYTQTKADAATAKLPMFSITEVGAEPDNVGLQFLTGPNGDVLADYANLHNYVVGNDRVLKDNGAWFAEAPGAAEGCCYDGMDGEFIRSTWRKKYPASPIGTDLPRVTTETGWGTNLISQDQQGKILVAVYLSGAARGWAYTFIYQLKDDQGFFGVYDSTFTPKLAATYIHNLTTILADTDGSFTPGTVNYTINGATATVHSLLMEKGNRTYELAIWNDQPTSENPSVPISVALPQSYPTINVYDVTTGTTPVATLSNVSAVPLTLTDHAMIVELGGTAPTPTPTPTPSSTPTSTPSPTACAPVITAPANGASVSGSVMITVSDNGCVGNFNRLTISGVRYSNHYDFQGTSYTLDTTKVPNEPIKLSVSAWDNKYLGQQGKSPITSVVVAN